MMGDESSLLCYQLSKEEKEFKKKKNIVLLLNKDRCS